MADYHALYLKLAGVQADAIDVLKTLEERLITAHQEAEEEIMNAPEPSITVLKRPEEPNKEDN